MGIYICKLCFLVCTALTLFNVGLVWGQDLESVQRRLWEKQEAKEKTEREVASLSRQERSVHAKLASLEDRIQKLEAQETSIHKQIQTIQEKQEELFSRIEKLRRREDQVRTECEQLLPRLWEMTVRCESVKSRLLASWPETDRHMVWLAEITRAARTKLDKLRAVHEQVGDEEQALRASKAKLEAKKKELGTLVQDLAETRLTFLRRVQKLRQKRQSAKEELAALKNRIQKLQSKLAHGKGRDFDLQKGDLPWPVKGRVIVDFQEKAGKSNRGLGFALDNKTAVKAVSWGEVAYNDKLRGFGRVIIIYHGQEYYSLYAFLAQSNVQVGHNVERGETLGLAGYYPQAQGPGLYFEVRKKQTPVDPRSWLATR